MFFRSSSQAERGVVHLSISVAEEKNLEVRRIYQPEVMLRMDAENADRGADNADKNADNADGGRITPRITFVKINPTKYRVKVEGAKEPHTLVFSESFHPGWRLYADKADKDADNADRGADNADRDAENADYGEIVASYFDGEIKEGTHKNIFLDGNTFETWGKEPLPEDKHLLVNGYANSWYIEPSQICEDAENADKDADNADRCAKNADGSYDMELIVEFAPQRLFYLGLFISGLTLIGCLGYLTISWITRIVKRR